MKTKKPEDQKKKKNILLVEDHRFNLLVLRKMLEKLGMNVVPAENGKEALEICMHNRDIDLVLMDIKMPVMDGYIAMMEVKKIRPGLKVIAETAYALAGDDKKILAAGFDDYLAKPITKDSLEEVLSRHL